MQAPVRDLVLQAADLRLLDGLRLNPRKAFAGRIRGERLTQKKGISIEFADYREYAEGDDLRHLDWNVLARLESPVIKTYRDEEDLAVHILVDCSPSMAFGAPPKAEKARTLACALGYVALAGGDAVYAWRVGQRARPPAALRGRSSYPRLAAWAVDDAPGERTLAADLKAIAGSGGRAGLAIVVSDGLDPEVTQAVRILAGRGHEVLFLQILSDVELDPDLEGDLRLVDSEGAPPVEITANSFTLREYRDRLSKHNAALAEECRRNGGRYALVRSNVAIKDFAQDILRRQGWAKA